jgi:hypothetical protein
MLRYLKLPQKLTQFSLSNTAFAFKRMSSSACFQMLLPSGAIECLGQKNDFSVKDHPGGIYSALRTISNGRKLSEFDRHTSRLLTSSRQKFGSEFDEANEQCLIQNFLPFISHMYANSLIKDRDMRYTTVIDRCSDSPGQFQMLCVAQEISPPPPSASVEIYHLKRLNPQVKSVEWAIQREEAERVKKP